MVVVPAQQSAYTPPATPQAMPRFGSKEIATLRVKGQDFANWTSVRVETRVTEAFPNFQFEVTETAVDAGAAQFAKGDLVLAAQQFMPGDVVQVFIGGISAVFGYITERHVGYAANQHGVRLIGVGDTYDLPSSMVPPDKWGGHDGKTWPQLAQDLMAHLGIKLIQIGSVDATPFKNIQVQPGETIMSVIERYAKMRGIVLGSNALGGLVAIGEHNAAPSGDLREGGNILSASCVIRDQEVYKKIYSVGQNVSGDGGSGDSQNKQIAIRDGTSTRNRYMITVADVADTQHGVERRADMEKVFTEGSFLEAQIQVQGWFKDNNQSDDPWRAGEYYTVTSPMLALDNAVLGCSGCAYDQTEQGTLTTLSMVDPIHMNGLWNLRAGAADYLQQQRERDAAAATPAAVPPKGPGL